MTTYLKCKDNKTQKIIIICDYSTHEIAQRAKQHYERIDTDINHTYFIEYHY